jgi:phosphoglycerol transferase MdoB-like AlkP superfamily enzyme
MIGHKQQIAIDLVCVAVIIYVLITEGRFSGLPAKQQCGVDPFLEVLTLFLYILLPVFASRAALLFCYYRSDYRIQIVDETQENLFLVQIFWMAAFGYWTISNFLRLLMSHNIKCL